MSVFHSRIAAALAQDFHFETAPPVVEWLEKNIVLPKSMSPAMPGPYSTRRQPTSRAILETWHPNSGVRSCVNVAGAQVAKTTEGVLGSAYRTNWAPLPELVVGPSEDWLRREISEKRFMALIDANPALRRMKPFDPSKFRKLYYELIGAPITIEGAGSSTATAGSTQGIIWIEEAAKIEHMDREEAPEAHPIKLAFERTKAFKGLEFHYLSFTANHSSHLAWQLYEAGRRTHFHVPCPHCGEFFPLEFELRKKSDDDRDEDLEARLEESQLEANPDCYRSLIWSPDARNTVTGLWSEAKVRETARYVCPHNGCEIAEESRFGMVAKFETKDHNEEAPKSAASFRRPSFYSPSVTLGDMACEFLKRGDLFTTGLQNFYNSWLALPWEKMTCNVKDEDVAALRVPQSSPDSYRKGQLPHNLEGMLAVAADPGQHRTHWLAGFLPGDESVWVVDYGTVGNVSDLVDERHRMSWEVHGGKASRKFAPFIGLVDSSDQPRDVLDMCRASGGFWWPTRGSDATAGAPWNRTRSRSHPDLWLYVFLDYYLKNEVYDRRIKQKRGAPIYLPTNAGPDLLSQLSGQQRVLVNGRSQWKKIPNDHWGDCLKQLVLLQWIIKAGMRPG